MTKALIAFLMLCGAIFCTEPSASRSNISPGRILFLMQAGQTAPAFKLYREYQEQIGHHDFELLQQVGLILLDQGSRSEEIEALLLTIFGAGITMNDKAMYILEGGFKSRYPQLQVICMNFLARFQSDSADELIKKALSSNYLPIRLEALFFLAEKKAPGVVEQAEALMSKVDKKLIPLFPQIYASVGSADAIKILRKLLAHPKEEVRIEAIISAAKYGRDDLLPAVRTLSTHHNMVQQEACAAYFGAVKDEESAAKLEAMITSGSSIVRLAALKALYRLGRQEVRTAVEKAAKEGDLFAIEMLGEMGGGEETLVQLCKSANIQVRINATLALLERQDRRCLTTLAEILIKDSRDFAFTKMSSPGKALSCYKAIPSARQNFGDDALPFELSLNIREKALAKATELPEKDFLQVANAILEAHQSDLVPTAVALLEELQTPEAIEILKKHQQKAGAPLIRNYCNLALYRLKEEGPYAENLRVWVAKQQQEDFIFRPLLPREMRDEVGHYQLTAQETSRLLIESFESLTQSQDELGLEVLLHAIQFGNGKNKYALAGLLVRAAH